MKAEDKQLLLNIASHISLARQSLAASQAQLVAAENKLAQLQEDVKKREEASK